MPFPPTGECGHCVAAADAGSRSWGLGYDRQPGVQGTQAGTAFQSYEHFQLLNHCFLNFTPTTYTNIHPFQLSQVLF